MKSTVFKVGTLVLCAVAVALGGYLWLGRESAAEQRLAESVKRSERVFERYFGADLAGAKQAMLEHIEYLDSLSRETGDQTHNPFAADAMAWWVRLATLEERAKGERAADYMREAVERCARLGKADCTEEGLRRQVERMDSAALAMLNK